MSMTRFVVLLFTSSLICFASAQEFDLGVRPSNMELDGKSFPGFASTFPNPQEKIEKALWKYARTFAKLTNERTHFQIIIAEELNREVNTDLKLYAQILPAGRNSTFTMAMSGELSTEERSKFDGQVSRLLLDFKKFYYQEMIQDEIKILEASILTEGEKYQSKRQMGLAGEDELLAISSYQKEVFALQEKIKGVLAR